MLLSMLHFTANQILDPSGFWYGIHLWYLPFCVGLRLVYYVGGYLHISSTSVKEERYQVWSSVKERDLNFFSHCIVFPVIF